MGFSTSHRGIKRHVFYITLMSPSVGDSTRTLSFQGAKDQVQDNLATHSTKWL